MTEVKRLSYYVPVSTEMLAQADELAAAFRAALVAPPPTAEQKRAAAARRAQELAAAVARHETARTQLSGRLVDVLDLHAPQLPEYALWLQCHGCEAEGYDAEPPRWPCTTWCVAAGQQA